MTTASPGFDGIRVRAAQTGMYETPILHGWLADVTALTAVLRSVICDRYAQPRALQRRWLVSVTDMLDWGGRSRACRHHAKEAKQASHFDGRYPASFEWTVKMWEKVPSPPRPRNMSHAQPS
jgi:hypothetical protein